ncbi:RAD55 family ATPase [Salinirussus salinus]|uniref:RAD55 family ATPase n=1 Tax=Salinirussus salinus TaxID=1198300 RepID=UPI001356BDA6|nr:ATPase domain-containing protein [Salinirussus salinus]
MYDLGPELDDATVDPGTNLLVAGPPLTGKRRLAMELLAAGAAAGEGAVAVTTRDSAERVLSEYRSLVADPGSAAVGVVDCVTRNQGGSPTDSESVTYVSSPTDMTGIGISFSEFLEEFYERGYRRNRVLLDSLSTLLMYTDLQTVFQFMHVFTNRVEDAGALGLYVVDSTAHDPETMNTLTQLFDGVVEVDEDREVSVRLPDPGASAAGG